MISAEEWKRELPSFYIAATTRTGIACSIKDIEAIQADARADLQRELDEAKRENEGLRIALSQLDHHLIAKDALETKTN